MYKIREVDGHDDEIADTLTDLHRLTFFDGASIPEFDCGHWWLAFHETIPVTGRNIRGRGRTRSIGANPSGASASNESKCPDHLPLGTLNIWDGAVCSTPEMLR